MIYVFSQYRCNQEWYSIKNYKNKNIGQKTYIGQNYETFKKSYKSNSIEYWNVVECDNVVKQLLKHPEELPLDLTLLYNTKLFGNEICETLYSGHAILLLENDLIFDMDDDVNKNKNNLVNFIKKIQRIFPICELRFVIVMDNEKKCVNKMC